jgi:hypothetical protein
MTGPRPPAAQACRAFHPAGARGRRLLAGPEPRAFYHSARNQAGTVKPAGAADFRMVLLEAASPRQR